MDLKIVPFEAADAEGFKEMNIAWLEKFFYVEARDEEVLGNPQKYIIQPGGHIFMAKSGRKTVGTLALIKIEEGIFELSKMAVTPEYQAKKIGQEMLKYSLDFAQSKNWKKLILYSNRKLENAIYLYRKFGFEEVEIEKDNPYARGDIKMEFPIS
ncbi:MAG TPA: GNAT family N-acetyltransferase [Salinimicrobium sp.]|nr:GNAT family N-acetyltransferase [Salinimicrobium sp.]